jgi:hypothetical protein
LQRTPAPALAAAIVMLAVTACGSGDGSRASREPSGTYSAQVLSASFPAHQRLAQRTQLRITVRNRDRRTIPNLAITITSDGPDGPTGGFTSVSHQKGIADPVQPTWIVDRGPTG